MAGNEINIGELSLEQLKSVKNQLEQEIRQFTSSYSGLKEAQSRFSESKFALNSLTPENENKEILVPVTSSMYVPGCLSDNSKVLVDIGTGYYVEKNVEDAQSFMERKVKFLEANLNSLEGIINEKKGTLDQIVMVLQRKLRLQEEAAKTQSQGKMVKSS